jgi:hypothetical protein
MSVKINELKGSQRKIVLEMCEAMFLHGLSYEFAIALHQGLGWPMVGLMENCVVSHAAVRMDGLVRDARGIFDFDVPEERKAFGKPFSYELPYILSPITIEDLRAFRPMKSTFIHRARIIAEVLWPQLPWEDSYISKVRAFGEALEDVSRRHGIWLRAPFPIAAPLLSLQVGDEGGYEFNLTEDGSALSMNRYLAPK